MINIKNIFLLCIFLNCLNACTKICSNLQFLDPFACECRDFAFNIPNTPNFSCNLICIGGQTPDFQECKCINPGICEISCPPMFRLESNTCQCLPVFNCYKTCENNWILDLDTCECKPQIACMLMCLPNQIPDDVNCKCVCKNRITCQSPFYFADNTCSCQLEELVTQPPPIGTPCDTVCTANKIVNPNTCECVCPFAIPCGFNEFFDQNTCSCTNYNGTITQPGCQLGCIPPKILNIEQCRCECFNLQCPPFLMPDYVNCMCVPQNLVNNPINCSISCPSISFLDIENCRCINPPIVQPPNSCNLSCLPPFTLNRTACRCVIENLNIQFN